MAAYTIFHKEKIVKDYRFVRQRCLVWLTVLSITAERDCLRELNINTMLRIFKCSDEDVPADMLRKNEGHRLR